MKEKDSFVIKAITNRRNNQINISLPRKKLSKEILDSIANNKKMIMVKLLKWE